MQADERTQIPAGEFDKKQLQTQVMDYIWRSTYLPGARQNVQTSLTLHFSTLDSNHFVVSDKFHHMNANFTKNAMIKFKFLYPTIRMKGLKGQFMRVTVWNIVHEIPMDKKRVHEPVFGLNIEEMHPLYYDSLTKFPIGLPMMQDPQVKFHAGALVRKMFKTRIAPELVNTLPTPESFNTSKTPSAREKAMGTKNSFNLGELPPVKKAEKKVIIRRTKKEEEEGKSTKTGDISMLFPVVTDIVPLQEIEKAEKAVEQGLANGSIKVLSKKVKTGPSIRSGLIGLKKTHRGVLKPVTSPKDVKEAIQKLVRSGKMAKSMLVPLIPTSARGVIQKGIPKVKKPEEVTLSKPQLERFKKWKDVQETQKKMKTDVATRLSRRGAITAVTGGKQVATSAHSFKKWVEEKAASAKVKKEVVVMPKKGKLVAGRKRTAKQAQIVLDTPRLRSATKRAKK